MLRVELNERQSTRIFDTSCAPAQHAKLCMVHRELGLVGVPGDVLSASVGGQKLYTNTVRRGPPQTP